MSILKEFRVTLETVTPMFLGGAEPKLKAEIRAPAFRGGMRYWLRALLGIQYANNISKIHEIEESVFGSTNQGSDVSIRAKEISESVSFTTNFSPDTDPGKNYLLWATQSANRYALPAVSTEIDLRVGYRKYEEFASAALWLLVHLGGLGTRSRRGLGSLLAKDPEKWNSNFPSISFNGQNYQKFLLDGIEEWKKLLNLKPITLNSLPKYDILHPSYSAVYIYQNNQKSFERWEDALEEFGSNLLMKFRDTQNFKSDHDGVLNVIKGTGKPQTVERAIFGLPMQFYYRGYHQEFKRNHRNISDREARKYATAQVLPSTKDSTKKIERRASPIHFKFTKLSNNSLTLVATFFKSEFLSSNFNLKIEPKGSDRALKKDRQFVSLPKYNLLEDFFSAGNWQAVYGAEFTRKP